MAAISDPRLTTTGPNGFSPEDVDLARLFGELKEESRLLITTEVELAKAELNEAKGHLIKGVAGYAGSRPVVWWK